MFELFKNDVSGPKAVWAMRKANWQAAIEQSHYRKVVCTDELEASMDSNN